MMFGLLGRVLPIGAAGLLMSNPVTLVIGAAFAGKQVISTRQRTLAVRRQQARASVRRFLDDIQFETSHELTEAARRIQRVLRDVFTARIVELQRTYQAMAEQAKRDVASTYEQQVERGKQLENDLAHFRELRSRLVAAGVAS
jgi:signal transduction histidine kinase